MANCVLKNELHRIVVNCVIYDDSYCYLALHRHRDLQEYPGLWTIPGGGVSAADFTIPKPPAASWSHVLGPAVRREIWEEAQIEVDDVEPLTDFAYIRSDGVSTVGFRFLARALSTNVRYDRRDAQAFAWLYPKDLPCYPFIPGVAEAIIQADTILKERMKGRQ